MDNKVITSRDNPLFKDMKKLKEKKNRDIEKKFLAEGIKFLQTSQSPRLIIGDYSKLISIKNSEHINNNDKDRIVFFESNLFNELSSQENSQGIILIYDYINQNREDISNNIVILDRIQDPGNMGTLIRTADSAGFKDIIILKGSVDVYNEKTVRATMGSLFNIRYYFFEESELIEFLKSKNYFIISSALSDNSIPYNKMKLSCKNALILGNEGQGISQNLLNISNNKVKIPIYGNCESLNVSVAGGILFYVFREKIQEQL